MRLARVALTGTALPGIALLLAGAALTSCASAGAGSAATGVSFGGNDLLLLRQHSDVLAVVAGSRSVFALTSSGVISYDRVFTRWRAIDGRLAEELRFAGLDDARVTALAADPVEDAVWVGVPGAVVLHRVAASQVQRISVAGVPQSIAFARTNPSDAYVLASGAWMRVSRAGFVTPVRAPDAPLASPAQLDEVYREHPTLRGQLPFLLRDAGDRMSELRNVRISAGTMSPDRPSEVWVGTIGDGLWLLDATFQQATPLRYGLLDESIGALARGAEGVWSAGDGSGGRHGLSFVSGNAQQFVWRTSDRDAALNQARVRDLVIRGNDAWLATDRGVQRVSIVDGERGSVANSRWALGDGLADNDVHVVLPRTGGVWVGTRRGLSFLTVPDAASRAADPAVDPSTPVQPSNRAVAPLVLRAPLVGAFVHDLAISDATLIVGTSSGLFSRSAEPGDSAPARRWSSDARLNRRIDAVATSDTVVLVVTDREAHLLDASLFSSSDEDASASLQDMQWPAVDVREIAPIVGASLDGRTAWIAGAHGVIAWSRETGSARVLRAGRDLPPDVRDIVIDETSAWIGTSRGLARVRRAREGGLP